MVVDNTSKEEKDFYKELKKNQQNSQDDLKAYYQKQLKQAQDDLDKANTNLDNIKSQKTVKVAKQQADGTFQYVGEVDQSKVSQAEKSVKNAQNNVDYYEKLAK